MARSAELTASARPVIFGEVLFDRFPDGSVVLGGAPFNVAWHLQAFGLKPLMISRVGNDALGREIRNTMQSWGMDGSGLQLDSRHPTGTVTVSFTDGEPCFDIVAERAYDFIDAGAVPPLPGNNIIYHGSLALREATSHNALQYLKEKTGAPCFVDINLRPPWWTTAVIEQSLQDASWLKLNAQEFDRVVPEHKDELDRIKIVLQKSRLQYLVVTRGSEGALAVDRTGQRFDIRLDNRTRVIDTVGAGDAFSSVLLLGNIRGWPLPESLQRAQDFANAIVGIRGATTHDRRIYRPFVEAWQLD